MDFRKLHYFVKVVEAGGFRRASKDLNIAQPALTRQIQSLENTFGVQLLSRTASGVTPTAQGLLLFKEAREILTRIHALQDLLCPRNLPATGEVRLGLPSAFADTLLSTLVESTQARHPSVRIICQEGATGLIESVENGSLDLSVASVAGERSTYQCEVELLMKEQDYLVTLDQGMPFGPTIPIDWILSMPLVLTPLPNARRSHLEDIARAAGVQLHVVAEAATLSAQLNLVLRGIGSAILPLSAARQMALRETIRITPIKGLLTDRALLLNRKTANPIATHAVAQEIRDIFRSLTDLINPVRREP